MAGRLGGLSVRRRCPMLTSGVVIMSVVAKVNPYVYEGPAPGEEALTFANAQAYEWSYLDTCRENGDALRAVGADGHAWVVAAKSVPDGFGYAWLEYTRRNASSRMALREGFRMWRDTGTLPGLITFDLGADPARYAFRVPGVGKVVVEIGGTVRTEGVQGRYFHGHNYPACRVTVDGTVVIEGSDFGVPAHRATDDMDAALSLLSWVAVPGSEVDERPAVMGDDDARQALELWVSERQEVRDALTSPVRSGEARAVVRAVYAGEANAVHAV